MTVGDLAAMAREDGLALGPDLSGLPFYAPLPLPNLIPSGSDSLSVRQIIDIASREMRRRRGQQSVFAQFVLATGSTKSSGKQESAAGTIISAAGTAADATTALTKAGGTFAKDPELQEAIEKGLAPTEKAAKVIAVAEIVNDVIQADGLDAKAKALAKGIAGLGGGEFTEAAVTALAAETGPLAPLLGAAAGILATGDIHGGVNSALTAADHNLDVIRNDPDAPTHFFELNPAFPRYQDLDPGADDPNDPFTQGGR
jgi:hypothetical protein